MSWEQLLGIIKEPTDPSIRGDDIEAGVCANDGEPFRQGPDGKLYCPWDGATPESQRTGPGRFGNG